MKAPSIKERTEAYRKNHWEHYNLTVQEYEAMLKKQKNSCALCARKMRKLQVDHDHDTGIVRGIVCQSCNALLRDFPSIYIQRLEFLKKFVWKF